MVTIDESLIKLFHEICYALDKPQHNEKTYENGRRTAYVECLEILQQWHKSDLCGFDFNIEFVYPLN